MAELNLRGKVATLRSDEKIRIIGRYIIALVEEVVDTYNTRRLISPESGVI